MSADSSSSTTTNENRNLRLKLEAIDQFTPDEQEHVAAFIEGALLRRHARQAFSGQAS
jgi:hypothetical protein